MPEPEALVYDYCFSEEFEAKIKKITQSASKSYVSVGRRRVRRAMVAGFAAVMVLATAIAAVAVQKIVVMWNETHNEKAGTLDVTFDIDDPNGHDGYFSSKYGINALIWSDGVYLFDISGTCDPETLYEMKSILISG